MRRYLNVTLSVILLLCVTLASGVALAGNDGSSSSYKLNTVVLDAGHGGFDPGALGKTTQEKNITLAIILKLGALIEKNMPGVKVIYTRRTDVFVELIKRAEIANKNDADLFISVHVNSNKNPTATGTDTWVMGQYKNNENFEVAKEENKVILAESNYNAKYEGFDPNSTESYIIFNLMQNTFIEQSLDIASEVENNFQARASRKVRGVKSAPFLVLWKTTMPSILIETGFISNPPEEKFLASDDGQNIMANAIFQAFKSYKDRVDSKTNVSFKQESKPEPETTMVKPPAVSEKKQVAQDSSFIYFCLQVVSSQKRIPTDSALFAGTDVVKELKVNETYKYLIGNEPEYNSILLLKDKLKGKFPDAFVMAFKNGTKIPLGKALEEKRLQTKP